eukprot:CAMPEP_0176008784 /NCGR_PEP_ID=MMETSP0120_2-20121206/3919_1 /TAXON_ID=160619 /ORGANISM="Kryptoperidinium foliaceum, Strain CCMP 1326" /LENGTH=272 /DNA_ID=CAMNT_0017341571 /DNA_START=151 /DNA_END=966 /DNA_ORIENTATION=+
MNHTASLLGPLLWLSSLLVAGAYPMILEVAEETERCVRLTIPQDDDANVAFLAIPGLAAEEDEENVDWTKEQKEIEEHFVFQMSEMKKYRVRASLPRAFPNTPPERISQLTTKVIQDHYDGELKSGLKVTVSNPKSTASRTMEANWFNPVVINHLRKSIRSREDITNHNPLEGYEMCFENGNDDAPIQVIVESVLVSSPGTEDSEDESPVFESSNLTPLAEQLSESIDSANSILKEMRYMEGRERRMRQTADSINARVRYFSYISVTVLLVV